MRISDWSSDVCSSDLRHGLRNAMIPLVALTAVQFGVLLGGSIVTESVFALQGLGHLAWELITRRDIPTVQAVVIILAAFFTILTLLGDLLNAWRSEERRVGKECVSKCRSRWSRYL